jgi:hypothetical protein
VQLASPVALEREQREGGREAVRDPGLDGGLGLELAQDRVEVDALSRLDRAERGGRSVLLDPCHGLLELAALRLQVLDEAALAHLSRVLGEVAAVPEEGRDELAAEALCPE